MRPASKDVISLPHTATVADAVAALSDANLKKAPVTNDRVHTVGIVSRSAINRLAISSYLEAKYEEKLTV